MSKPTRSPLHPVYDYSPFPTVFNPPVYPHHRRSFHNDSTTPPVAYNPPQLGRIRHSYPPHSAMSGPSAPPLGPPPLAKIPSPSFPDFPFQSSPPSHSRQYISPTYHPNSFDHPPPRQYSSTPAINPYPQHSLLNPHHYGADAQSKTATGSGSSMSEVEGEDEFMAHQTRGVGVGVGVGGGGSAAGSGKKKKGKSGRDERDELDDSPAPTSPNPRGDKRRRTRKGASTSNPDDSPMDIGMGESPDNAEYPQPQRRASGLAPIKPIGFAASRENRRESGGGAGEAGALPSPVVMGFDFQKVDEDQLKTVRDTIGIKAQQEALIAQRRRDLAASTPNTPKELTFKGWQPKDQDRAPSSAAPPSASGSIGVGRRRDKTRDKVERMSINTAGGDKDGAKSAPMNQGLSGQPSDSQSGTPHAQGVHPNGHHDPRTAPMSNVRGSRADEGEFNRQQGPAPGQYYRRYEPGHGHSHNRSVTDGGRSSGRIVTSSSRGYDDRMPPPTAGGGGSRNGYQGGSHQGGHPGPGATYTSHEHGESGSNSPSPPPPPRQQPHAHHGPPQMSARREAFLAPYNQLYDLLHQTEGLRYNLQDLMVRYEGLYAGQQVAMQEFKTTAASSNTLLENLQQSAESLKEMVRYEVGRSIAANAASGGSGEKKEVDELKERIKKLEEKLEKKD